MKMKTFLTTSVLLLWLTMPTKAQTSYSGRIETGYMNYLFRTITVEPGPNWKGYNLNNRQNGFNFNSINGVTFQDRKIFTGIGAGYSNFDGIDV
jgi:hypothetical protein